MNALLKLATTGLVALLVACGGGESADTGHYAGGTVTGLQAGNSVHLSSGQQQLTLSADGTYRFGRFPSGTAYNISATSTSTAQTCSIANGNGVITDQDIDNIAVTCVANFQVSGVLSGYQLATTPVRLSLNGTEFLDLRANGSFSFVGFVGNGSTYTVAIAAQPPELSCTVTNGNGTVTDANVSNVMVDCVPAAGFVQFSVTGLQSPTPLVVQIDGSALSATPLANRQVNAADNGSYSFAAAVPIGSTYNVSVAQQPANYVCTVSNGSGTFSLNGTPLVRIDCAPPLYVISGVALFVPPGWSITVELYENVNETLVATTTVSAPPGNTAPVSLPFSFGRRFSTGFSFTAYSNSCSGSGSGTIDGADVTDITLDCNNF